MITKELTVSNHIVGMQVDIPRVFTACFQVFDAATHFGTRWPVVALMKIMGAQESVRRRSRMASSHCLMVLVSLLGTVSHLFTTITHALPSDAIRSASLKS
jgi:hypothetical protein